MDGSHECAVINCYENKKSSFRINTLNLFSLSRVVRLVDINSFWTLGIRPNLTYEVKVLNSSFSVAQELIASLNFSTEEFVEAPGFELGFLRNRSFTYEVGPRYYYKMKKRILEGSGGNNLAGPYLFGRLHHTEFRTRQDGFLEFGIGNQREILGRLFMDISIYGRGRIYGEKRFADILDSPIGIDFKIGYILK